MPGERGGACKDTEGSRDVVEMPGHRALPQDLSAVKLQVAHGPRVVGEVGSGLHGGLLLSRV